MALPNGNAARIRKILQECLQDSITPTAQEIADKLHLPTRNVSNALSQMPGVYRHRQNHANVTIYSLAPFHSAKPKRKSPTVTPPAYHNWQTPEMTLENYNLYEGRQLALDGPR